jgi:NAD(P)-dependent dehydrogenase (short-subunit alcohol dehydrogenase family)
MSREQLEGTTALVTGASRGFGRAIAGALCTAGAQVVGVARDERGLDHVQDELGDRFLPVVADAADPTVAGLLLDQYRPRTLVLNAGATPLTRPLQHHTWETFARTWEVDVKHVFYWVREALLLPLEPGSTIVAMSSGAAVQGSPLSGGYAGAKATIRFITGYAADEADRAGLDLRFVSLLPRLTPATELGTAAVASYAQRQGVDVDTYLQGFGPTLSVDQVGDAVAGIATDQDRKPGAYLLTAAGLMTAP